MEILIAYSQRICRNGGRGNTTVFLGEMTAKEWKKLQEIK